MSELVNSDTCPRSTTQDRLESAYIMVSDSPADTAGGDGVKCGQISDHTQEPEVAHCGGSAAGRYLSIDLAVGGGGSSSGAYITICEIEVYGMLQPKVI